MEKNNLSELSKEQLIAIIQNGKLVEKDLRRRLHLLTGCDDFGGCDGTNGLCIGCSFDCPGLSARCLSFKQEML